MPAPRIVDTVDHEARALIEGHERVCAERMIRIDESIGRIESAQTRDREEFAAYRKDTRREGRATLIAVISLLVTVLLGVLGFLCIQVFDRVMHAPPPAAHAAP